MTVSGKFVYTVISDTTAGLGTGIQGSDGNGFAEATSVSGEITIPSSFGQYKLISILTYATRNCNKITKLVLPDTLIKLEFASLTEISGLKEVRIPASVTTISGNNDCYRNARRIVFESGSKLTQLGENFMRYSPYIKEVVLPYSIKTIGSYFAQGCTGLKRVYFCGSDADFSSIADAFDNCPNKAKINIFVSYDYKGTSFGGFSVLTKTFSQCFASQKNCITRPLKCTKDLKPLINIMLTITCT